MAAANLVRNGVPVTVFEAGTDLSEESRASTFHPPTLDMLDRLGVAPGSARALGLALVAMTIAAFALAAVATFGILPDPLWTVSVAVGALASLAILVLWFHPWLALGIAIDALLLWAALVAGWTPGQGLPV